MSKLSRDSHYIPQATLRLWSQDGLRIQAYQILVPHAKVPIWKSRPIKGMAFHRDLYTTFSGSNESDSFEHWIGKEFEEPGIKAVNKLLSNSRLTRDDWKKLACFVAAQDVRTPLNFIEQMQVWDQRIKPILENSVNHSIERIQDAQRKGLNLQPEGIVNEFSDLVHVKIGPTDDKNPEQLYIKTEVNLGRNYWVASMRHLLNGVGKVLCTHRWSVAEPYGIEEWPLTDHPVIRLNYYGPDNFNFKGGWNSPGTELMMPVSPRHLLYVQVGKKTKNRFTFDFQMTRLIQEMIVKRAHRWIFSKSPAQWIETIRPRLINPELYKTEQKAWKEWHKKQIEGESWGIL